MVAYRRSVLPSVARLGAPKRLSARPRQRLANHLPIDEVLAAIDRQAREILESGGHQVVVIARAADARIGIHPRYNRIWIAPLRVRQGRETDDYSKSNCLQANRHLIENTLRPQTKGNDYSNALHFIRYGALVARFGEVDSYSVAADQVKAAYSKRVAPVDSTDATPANSIAWLRQLEGIPASTPFPRDANRIAALATKANE